MHFKQAGMRQRVNNMDHMGHNAKLPRKDYEIIQLSGLKLNDIKQLIYLRSLAIHSLI